jgi:hypothetical protein
MCSHGTVAVIPRNRRGSSLRSPRTAGRARKTARWFAPSSHTVAAELSRDHGHRWCSRQRPHFNENKPLRNLAAVTNTIDGAMDIQKAFRDARMGSAVWSDSDRMGTLCSKAAFGRPRREVGVYQFARSDQQANPLAAAEFILEP